jgi:hypothetical protein
MHFRMRNKLHHTILCLGLIFYSSFNKTIAQDTLSVHTLLKQIQDQQVQHDPFFIPGIFPSYVTYKKAYKEKRKDNNVFYNVIISYTLKTLRPKLPPADQNIVDSIIARSEKLIAKFKNTKGRETYNFWRTDSAYRLPYLWGLRLIKKNILDDDQDCTSMSLLSLGAPVSAAQQAHSVMQHYVNDTRDPTPTALPGYKSYAAYSTWLGNKLPPVLDVCVISNILSFVQTYDLTWSKADSASLDLVIAALNNKDHITKPVMIAPYYGATSIILYHLARLMSIKPIPALEKMKGTLINDALNQLQQTNNEFEKIILSNALLKWNSGASIPGSIKTKEIEKSDLPFFIGNIPSIFKLSLQKPLSKKGIGVYYHYCPAYNNALLLEYLVLKNENAPELAVEKKQ